MRLSLLTTAAALAVTAPHDAKTQQWIVIGTSGQVVDVDPLPFLPESRRLRKLQQREEEEARRKIVEELANAHRSGHTGGHGLMGSLNKAIIEDGFFDDDEDTIATTEANDTEAMFDSEPVIPDIDTLIIAGDDSHQSAWQKDLDDAEDEEDGEETGLDIRRGDKDQASKVVHGAHSPREPSSNFMTDLLFALDDDSTFAAVQGSIVFAELSCLFVAFIGCLVHSIPLWATFSFGQRSCLFVAFAAALLYQVVAIGWYYSFISPDVTVGISSLITRTISLGMVPITTTSFMGRARLAAELAAIEDKAPNQTQALVTPIVHSVVVLFLICGECVVLGAALFGSMVHVTPGVGLRASPRSAYASALAITSGAAYHVVCLGWWLGRLELLDVVCLAPACQALLTAAVALLYGAVVDLYNRIDAERYGPSESPSRQLSPTVSLSAQMARFC